MKVCDFGPDSAAWLSFEVQSTFVGNIVYPPGGRYGPRVQSDFQLVLLHTGAMDVRIDGTSHTVPPGTVTLLKPGHVEEFYFADDRETWHRWIAVTASDVTPDQRAWLEALPLHVSLTDRFNQLTDMMLDLQSASTGESAWRGDTLNALAVSALGLFVLQCQQDEHCDKIHPAVLITKTFIRNNYQEDVHLSDMSNEAHLTPAHLVRLFRKSEGRTPMAYLWAYRVQRALSLLRDTGLSVSDIADRTGFKTSHHFTRMIKQRTGMTPTEVRRRSWIGI